MGAANSVCKLTVDSIALLEQLEPNRAEGAAKRAVRLRVQALLQQQWPTCCVLPFGSSESNLGFGGCDVDLGIFFHDVRVDALGALPAEKRVELLTTACERLSRTFQVRAFVRRARVPVLKLWDPQREVACDVCVGSGSALLNTALLRYYGRVDPRVRPLVFAVKYWAKQRGINDAGNGTLSSYGYTLLLIFYLQSQCAHIQLPAVHADFQDLQSQTNICGLLKQLHSVSTVDFPSTFGTSAVNSVGALLAGFFDFYAHRFNFEHDVVSIRTGSALSKTTKWSHPVSWRMSIEDPFELAHDVGRVVFHRKGHDLIRSEFARASDLLSADRRLGDICVSDETSWDLTATCYICYSRSHPARSCDQCARQHSAAGSGCNMVSRFSDCWYCGQLGHYKAECPMLFYRDIPCPVDAAKSIVETTSDPSPPTSLPVPIPVSPASTTVSFLVCKERPWERGMSPSNLLMLRLSRKKKRARYSSSLSTISSTQTSPWIWSSGGLPHAEKRQEQQKQEHYRRDLALLARKFDGSNACCGTLEVGKVLCYS
ncbi:unnamed protein product [Hyaloperonospora brassicae]|uniref:CCHC-type domain-containing protein n=1 Tax=Hyaloperonospora brassicae TaxID=162125 RepID=A0AAV0TNE2_HYABA|nr:unnamed protein product [Hyaloperonospora brassicae]